jgi:hypothetical protein
VRGNENARIDRLCIDPASMPIHETFKNHFTVRHLDHGDNLSVRNHIQNSISLTMTLPPRIIRA